MFDTIKILGVPFIKTTRQQFVQALEKHVENEEKAFVVTANPEIVMKVQEDEEFKHMIDRATYITADGIGVVKAASLLGERLPERVTGYETMMDLLSLSNKKDLSIYLLGAQEETIKKTVHNINKDFPNVKIAGYHHGFFDWNSEEIPNEIKKTEPDFIFVALGVPRQEKWISENMYKFRKGVFMGIGGSFDVIAGTVQRAPQIWQKANLEWAYRILKQPERLGRAMSLPKFALRVIKERVQR
jgi:N-acetylglucosaminyldiphosphoundecaprenol N-acetyl-beta-D-mannosaminyltransferase